MGMEHYGPLEIHYEPPPPPAQYEPPPQSHYEPPKTCKPEPHYEQPETCNEPIKPHYESGVVKKEVKTEKKEIPDSNVDTEMFDNEPEPIEITSIYKCPICFKKYASSFDVELHISQFHNIPHEIQKQALALAIIEEQLNTNT